MNTWGSEAGGQGQKGLCGVGGNWAMGLSLNQMLIFL